MAEHPDKELVFVTVSMAEILLAQNLVAETTKVVAQLKKSDPDNPRVIALSKRLDEITKAKQTDPISIETKGIDYVELELKDGPLLLRFELTDTGIAIARAKVRFSGYNVLRLFTAQPGPRGVRTSSRDITIAHQAAELLYHGLPKPAVHVAAVGYLANTGTFVPLARSVPFVVNA